MSADMKQNYRAMQAKYEELRDAAGDECEREHVDLVAYVRALKANSDLLGEARTAGTLYDVVRKWRTVQIEDLVSACKSVQGAKYLLLQRPEVHDAAQKLGIHHTEMAERMISNAKPQQTGATHENA